MVAAGSAVGAEIRCGRTVLAILGPLRGLDAVAYLRFASVYKHYDSVDDFEAEIESLRQAALVTT